MSTQPSPGEWKLPLTDLDPDQGGPRTDLQVTFTDPRWLSFGTQRKINKALMILHAVTVARRPLMDDENWALDALYDLVNRNVRDWNLPDAEASISGPEVVARVAPAPEDLPAEPTPPITTRLSKIDRIELEALHKETREAWERACAAIRAEYRPLDNLFPEHARFLIQAYQERLLDGSKSSQRSGVPARSQGITSAA